MSATMFVILAPMLLCMAAPHDGGLTFRQHINIGVNLSRIARGAFLSILRRPGTSGTHAFAGFEMLGLFWAMICLGLGAGPYSDAIALVVLVATIGTLILHKLLRRHDPLIPSTYTGRSWIPGDESRAKCFWEPLILVTLSMLLVGLNQGLAVWLFFGGIGHGIASSADYQAVDADVRHIRDAWLRQKHIAEMARQGLY